MQRLRQLVELVENAMLIFVPFFQSCFMLKHLMVGYVLLFCVVLRDILACMLINMQYL